MESKSIGPKVNKVEQKKENPVLELFNLSEEQKRELKERVEEHKGLVRVFIHPIAKLKKGKILENRERVSDILVRNMFSEKAPPIIVFENAGAIEGWKKLTEKHTKITKEIYLVPTILYYPYPIVPGKPEPSGRDVDGNLREEDYDYVEEGVAIFMKSLNDLGVKKIVVGGTSLEVLDGRLNRCVGSFIAFMKKKSDIELRLSLGTAPINKSGIRKSHPGLIEDL